MSAVHFREGLVVHVSGVLFRIKKIKLSKNEMLLRKLTPKEIKQVKEHVKKEQAKKEALAKTDDFLKKG